jgi:hypothetical protein
MNALDDPFVRAEVRRAWHESQPDDPISRHEEGGFVIGNPDGSFEIERWPRGEQSRIAPPPLDTDNR